MKMENVKFSDIAGYSEEKKEVKEISNLISHAAELKEAGGEIPKGLMLIGRNGVGKTLFANALINETQCNVVKIDHTNIDKVGELSPYIQAKVEEAVSQVPCILYVDDFFMLHCSSNMFDEEPTKDPVDILISYINKYSYVEGLFLLIVSDSPTSFDSPLIKSGRIDRTILLNRPSQNEREEIINYYCQNKQLDSNVDIKKIAKILNGFTGADIRTVINNSVAKAFIRGSKTVNFNDINDAYYDKIFSTSSKNLNMSNEDLITLANHEAGHTVIGLLSNPDSIHYATIKPRGGCLGFVNTCSDDVTSRCYSDWFNDLCVALAGRVAEERFLDRASSGCRSDIERAVDISRYMVRIDGLCGMEYINIPGSSRSIMATPSSAKLKAIEDKEDELMNEALKMDDMLLHSYYNLFSEVAHLLYEKQFLVKDDIAQIIEKYHLAELDLNKYKIIKQRIGIFGKIDAQVIMRRFNIGYHQAKLVISRLKKDKMIKFSPSSGGYQVIVD